VKFWGKNTKWSFQIIPTIVLVVVGWMTFATNLPKKYKNYYDFNYQPADTNKKNNGPLPYPIKQKPGDEPQDVKQHGLLLKDPSNVKTEYQYNPKTGNYEVTQKMGNLNYRNPTYMTLEEYKRYDMEKSMQSNWRKRMDADAKDQRKEDKALIPKIHVSGEAFDRIFGGNTVDIRPNGSAELIFGVNSSKNGNPAIPLRNRRITTFDFNQKIQLNVIGKIGEKLKLTTSYNTEATFDFENQMKVEYTGLEDEILQKIEAGNVNLPLNSQLITGSQSLFGVKTQMRFGKLTATTVLSQQRGKKTEVDVPPGGGQLSTFIMSADNYEANKHYFLSQYFRDNYDRALAALPFVNSQVNITRIEVWITNRQANPDNRNILGLMDLAEDTSRVYAKGKIFLNSASDNTVSNDRNTLYNSIKSNSALRVFEDINNFLGKGAYSFLKIGRDYEKVIARKLTATEFNFNPRLGYISLNQALNADEVLAVAYQYTLNGKTYQVGEFSTDGVDHPKTLILKLLKGTLVNVKLPLWDLMMKNIYNINAYQVSKDDFKMDILHTDIKSGLDYNFIPVGAINKKVLLRVMNLDTLNRQLDPQPDGFFDFVENITIVPDKGRIIFPVTEPFGSHLYKQITSNGNNQEGIEAAKDYVFQQLYDSTRFQAQQVVKLNRFKLRGTYKSSGGSEISLNALNIPQGAVQVTCGGQILTENSDYTVDYNLGRVKIINEGILNSGKPIKVSVESNSMFSIQQKSMIGTRLDYKLSNDINIGGTIMRVAERPLTQKVNIGDEPIANTIAGLDGNYRTELPLLTRLVDKLPFYDTKEVSTVSLQGEVAKLFPGNARAITRDGISYIDDFESSQSTIDLKTPSAWSLASIPQGQPSLFPEASFNDTLPIGFNRAKLAWYSVDPIFTFNVGAETPEHIRNDKEAQSNNQVRFVMENEIFPQKQFAQGQQMANMPVLDLAFYPEERGPYNFDAAPSAISSGIGSDGKLLNPKSRWGGIMRRLETTDFENANIQYVQFWMMDPFNADNPNQNNSGELYLNLGEISEDVLKDSRKAFENGLPTSSTIKDVDTSAWGRVTKLESLVYAFDSDPNSRQFQDIGLDGLSTGDETQFFQTTYLDRVAAIHGTGSVAYQQALNDASADDYHFFRGDDYDQAQLSILDRYKKFNGLEGNSPVSSGTSTNAASTIPNAEDINRDNTLNENETYYQYRVKLDPNSMVVGKNYITNKVRGQGNKKNGEAIDVDWYQFRIPVREPERIVGSISDFRSIRFIRLFMKGFTQPIIARFGKLELVRSEWRKYQFSLDAPGENQVDDKFDQTLFNITAVNVEEHSSRVPVNYVLPPGIDRQRQVNAPNLALMNEQAMQYDFCDLKDGDARASFKTMDVDMRMYKHLKFFTHLEKAPNTEMEDNQLTCFIRLGTDFNENYYEYEVPLKVTPDGATAQTDVWPEANNFDIDLEELVNLKVIRDNEKLAGKAQNNRLYSTVNTEGKKISIIGNPILSSVRTIVIGIRNPKKRGLASDDDGKSKCGSLWINELRLTDFNNFGGWATIGRANVKLADLAMLGATGGYSTPGFGSVDKKLNERSKDYVTQYDLSAQIELGKLIPRALNLRVPFYVGFGETFIRPMFNPSAPDLLFEKSLEGKSDSLKQFIRETSIDYTRRKGFNFTNVKKEKGKNASKSHFWDIENWTASYSFSETFKRNINIEYNTLRNYRGGIGYSFSSNAKPFTPFSKLKLGKSDWAKLITDINIGYAPSRVGFKTDFIRDYQEMKNRGSTDFIALVEPTYQKNFTLIRNYDLQWNLTKSLTFDFNAINNSRIDEPAGRVKRVKESDLTPGDTSSELYQDYKQWLFLRDSIQRSIFSGGRNTAYQHNANLNWTVPINKIPTFNWINATVRYSANYQWNAMSLGAVDSLGNTIQNSNNTQYNTTLNMNTLYNKWKYYKKISTPKKPPSTKKPSNKMDDPEYLRDKSDSLQRVYNKTKLKLKDLEKEALKKEIKYLDHRADSIEKANKPPLPWMETIVKAILGVKNVNLTLGSTDGTLLPGYIPKTQYLGTMQNAGTGNLLAPGYDFVFGQQVNIAQRAAENDWLVKSASLNNQYTRTSNNTFSARATYEPFKDFRVQLSANKTDALNNAEFFRYNKQAGEFQSQNPQTTGNYSVSFISIRSAFERTNDTNFTSKVFTQFLENRKVISSRLANQNSTSVPDSGYDGYFLTNQDVVIPAFLSAYSGKNPNDVFLGAFPKIPLPNWTINYDGLSKIEKFKKYFKSVTVSHGYKSTYTVSSYTTNLEYVEGANKRDIRGNFLTPKVINALSIAESFSPLLGVDLQWQNRLTTKLEYKKDRTLNLSLSNIQLTEMQGQEVTTGLGYIFKDVVVPVKVGGSVRKFKSDLTIRSDVSIRSNKTIVRRSYDNSNQATMGQRTITLKNSVNYQVTSRVTVRLFLDIVVNKPFVSTSFPTSNTNGGVSIRFTLGS
jgi:cell surface protein SprA